MTWHSIIYALYLLVVPAIAMWLGKRWQWVERVSPMTLLYIIGLLVANLTHFSATSDVAVVNNAANAVAIPLAIPLMLMSCNLSSWSTGRALKVLFCGLAAVVLVSTAGFFLFRQPDASQEFARVCAVTTGMYTGGIPNVGAIAQGVGLSNEQYLYITSYDLIITGLYLVFIIVGGKAVFRRLLPPDNGDNHIEASQTTTDNTHATAHYALAPLHLIFLPSTITLFIAALSVALASLLGNADGVNMTVLILTLTTLSIGASFLPFMKRVNREAASQPQVFSAFDLGLYFVYLFCFAISNSCDIRQMNLMGSLHILAYIGFVIFGSLALQILLAKIFKIDGDSVLVSSVALINSPPFVPMVAAILGNKDIIVLGITIGLLGYMIGNYVGIGFYHLLILIQ